MVRRKLFLVGVMVLCAGITLSAALRVRGQAPGAQPAALWQRSPARTEPPNSAAALSLAERYAAQYDYDRALEALSAPAIQNKQVAGEIQKIKALKESLVPYEGDIRHIFFHSLIVYPEMIFRDRETPMGGYNAGFSEKAELEKMLPQLYERGYVLYDLAECFELRNGEMARKEILLPPGKQPLILSVDDVAYAYGDGYAQKLTVKEDGSLVNLVKNPQGVTEEMPDGDVFGVVDAFVREHPDFSYRGHKGTLAMTGYQGAFGFSFDTPSDREAIRAVAAALRADGWSFASHSYTHNRDNFFGPESKPENIEYDTNKWVSNVAPFFGPTELFIAPFGYRVQQPGLQYILDAGFRVYCTVDRDVVNELHDDYALMSRIEIGGYSMTYYRDVLCEKFFNVDEVFDAAGRPPVI